MGSPSRRKLSAKHNLIAIDEDEEEIENELRNRRLEAINKSTELRRRSAAPPLAAGLNSAQLVEHCKDCIKLSTENKINSKNAFNLLLIDFMAAMTKKKDSEISQNFQVASCTLDASVKIYGYRVDAVHTDAMKIAGNFLGKDKQDLLNEDDMVDDGQDKVEAKLKSKKRRRKMNLVAPGSITLKSETEALLNMAPEPSILSKHGDGSKLLTRVPKYNDGSLLVVNPEMPCWVDNSTLLENKCCESFANDELMRAFCEIDLTSDDKLCTAVSAIEFGKDDEEPPSELDLTQTSNCEFDINASIHNISIDEEENIEPPPRLTVPCTGYDSGEEIALPCKASKGFQQLALSDLKRKLSMNDMEYSMFDEKLFKVWAGPTYWKVQPLKTSAEENNLNEDASRPVAIKRTRRGKAKETIGLFEVSDEVMTKQFGLSEKTVLAKNTLCNWKASSVTLADDYKYQPKDLFSLFQLPFYLVKRHKENSMLVDVIDENDESNGSNHNEELEYCSQMIPEEDEQMDADDIGNKSAPEVELWDSANMVAVPNKVKKIAVGSFQRKKYIDIKLLKKGIWATLAQTSLKEVTEKENASVKEPSTFSELLKICPSKLPGNASGTVNPPLMFNALLHLANEKCLVLKQPRKLFDFEISQ